MIVDWIWVVVMEVEKKDKIQDTFWRYNLQDLLMNCMQRVRKKEELKILEFWQCIWVDGNIIYQDE